MLPTCQSPGLRTIRCWLRLKSALAAEGAVVVAVCAAIEAEIAQLEEADRAEFLAELGLEEPGLNRVIRGAYTLLGLLHLLHRWPEGDPGLDGEEVDLLRRKRRG